MQVDQQRLRADLEANGEFGRVDADEGWGRTVFTGTEADRQARDYFVGRLQDAGLAVRIDEVGNVVGRWEPESADPDAAPVAAGSHLDSVPEGGIFDGPLGTYAALEAVRTMQDAGVEPARPVEVVSFTEEEGQRFDAPLLGSKVAAGSLTPHEALETTDDDEITLRDALESIGYRGEGRLDAGCWDSFLELHVEQGTRLETAGASAGVVTDITGITHCRVELEGHADHAGATPMPGRQDALAAAAEFVLDVERATNDLVATESETAVGTVGKAEVTPNATNVIPGHVRLGLDVRDVDYESMNEIIGRARESLRRLEDERGVETSFDRYFDLEPVPMAQRCREALTAAADRNGIAAGTLHSAAGHDTMEVAAVTDVGMLFAPSRDGISHNPREWTDWDDCRAATQVLTGALAELAGA